MSSIPAIKAVMTTFPYSLSLDASLEEARALMTEHEVRHLPIKGHDGQLLGVISDRQVYSPAGSQDRKRRSKVGDLEMDPVVSVDLEVPLDDVLAVMAACRLGAVLVTKDERLAGIFTVVDVCRLFANQLRACGPGDLVA